MILRATYLRKDLIGLSPRDGQNRSTATTSKDAHTGRAAIHWGGDFLQGYWESQARPLEDVMGQP